MIEEKAAGSSVNCENKLNLRIAGLGVASTHLIHVVEEFLSIIEKHKRGEKR